MDKNMGHEMDTKVIWEVIYGFSSRSPVMVHTRLRPLPLISHASANIEWYYVRRIYNLGAWGFIFRWRG